MIDSIKRSMQKVIVSPALPLLIVSMVLATAALLLEWDIKSLYAGVAGVSMANLLDAARYDKPKRNVIIAATLGFDVLLLSWVIVIRNMT